MTCLFSHAQEIVGQYGDHFGHALILKQDSSFEFTWHLDLESSWTKGKWKLNKDTLLLQPELIYDTLRTTSPDGVHDSLVVSKDLNPELITTLYLGYLTTGWQNRVPPPHKLFFKGSRLYRILSSGNLDKSKQEEFWTKKKFSTWFKKTASPWRLRTTVGLLPAYNVLASPINKNEFVVGLGRKSF